MEFRDYFSKQAEIYFKARPTYPESLFEYLSGIAPAKELCWDCATGNGQAAVSLAKYFRQVIATDGSEQQIKNAVAKDNITYRIATAEHSNLPDNCTDLITVATAAHWFKHDEFYAEAQRVSKPNGILAVWTYSEARITPAIDELMEWFMYGFLLDYWPDGRMYVRKKYETLPFPFKQIATPDFFCERDWTKAQWLDYIRSWSSYNSYVAKQQSDPLELLLPKLDKLWRDDEVRPIKWQLHLKCARLNAC
ncbi:MAG TPA: class I SAM-dependent methyltransferase [Chitinophagales bacterium]|nr:class I SAM-dependent methyltransferase [Chitinophagales bacterium]